MKKGFKKWAEEQALQLRRTLNIHPYQPLPFEKLAESMRVRIFNASDLPLSDNVKDQLMEKDPTSWSAFTLPVSDKDHVVLYNPKMSRGRISSSIMHELAHLICGHKPSKLVMLKGINIPSRTFDQEQEEEADWLAGCILLPREALIFALRKQINKEEILSDYQVSEELLRYRVNITGVRKQLKINYTF